MKYKYVTVYVYGRQTICTVHRSKVAAIKAAKGCEKRGGSEHVIWQVKEIRRDKRRKVA